MIGEEAQYRITQMAIREFEVALARLDQTEAHQSPAMRALMRTGMESQLEDLREQLAAYETYYAGRIQAPKHSHVLKEPDIS